MGFNTAMMVLNDHLHMIEKDKEFGLKVAEAIRYTNTGITSHHNSFSVLSPVHADYRQMIVVEQNNIHRMDDVVLTPWQLKDLAARHGYRLVKVKENG